MYELFLVSQENIFRDRKSGQGSQLLYDNGNALIVRFHLILWMNLFSVEDKGSASDAVNTGQHVCQR